jgi:GTP-binding protein
MFVDYAEIKVKAGKGGNGCISFRREKYVPKGGPDGGDGGKGGDIIFQADPELSTLMDFHYKKFYNAQNGENGRGKNQFGRDGEDLVIKIPSGTIVKDKKSQAILIDLVYPEQTFVVAKGGKGGKGNTHFKSATRQAPRKATSGASGEERELTLELKLLADIGLVGLPNSGKSTLLSQISKARPKIAAYPFTTLTPHLGIVGRREYESFVVADIPGLIEGAHKGKGLGIEFLKHIQRTKILVYLLDVTAESLEKDYKSLYREMELFDPSLVKKPYIIVLNKIDLLTIQEKKKIVFKSPPRIKVYKISALTKEGLELLLFGLEKMLTQSKKEEPPIALS